MGTNQKRNHSQAYRERVNQSKTSFIISVSTETVNILYQKVNSSFVQQPSSDRDTKYFLSVMESLRRLFERLINSKINANVKLLSINKRKVRLNLH